MRYWLIGVMLLAQMYNWLAPEPEMMDMALPVTGLIAFALFIWLAYRVDRGRTPNFAT